MTINDNELPKVIPFYFNIRLLSKNPLFEKFCRLIKPDLPGLIESFQYLQHYLRVAYFKPELQKDLIEKSTPFSYNDVEHFNSCLIFCAKENKHFFIERFESLCRNENFKNLAEASKNKQSNYLTKYEWKNKNIFLSEILSDKYCNSVDFDILQKMPLSVEQDEESIVTELYFDVNIDLELYFMTLNKIKNKEFPSVSVVTIFGENDKRIEEMSEAIKQYCPQIQIIQYESAIQERKKSTLDIMLGNNDVVLQKQQTVWTPNGRSNKNIFSSRMSFPQKRDENIFSICKDSSNTQISVDGGVNLGGTYVMHEAGKALNKPKDQELPRVRTCVYSVAIEEKEIKLTKYVPEKFETFLIVKKIENKDLSKYQSCSPEKDGVYYYFAQSVPAQQWTRLFSVDANESLEAYIAPTSKIKFAKGDDGFVYAYSKQACEIQYVLNTPAHKKKLGKEHPAKKIIKEFKSNKSYSKIATKQAPKIKDCAKQWLEELFESCAGACRERCLAVWYQILNKHPELREEIRLIRIDNNHVRLEIIINGIVYQEDLGGAEAEMIIEHNTKPLPVFEPSDVRKEENIISLPVKHLESPEYQGLKQLFVKKPKKMVLC